MDRKSWLAKQVERRASHNEYATTLEVAAKAASTLVVEDSPAYDMQVDLISHLINEAERHRSLANALEMVAQERAKQEGENVVIETDFVAKKVH